MLGLLATRFSFIRYAEVSLLGRSLSGSLTKREYAHKAFMYREYTLSTHTYTYRLQTIGFVSDNWKLGHGRPAW